MDDFGPMLRKWLETLSDDDCLAVANCVPSLQRILGGRASSPPSAREARRRGLPKVRKHLKVATDDRLAKIARESVGAARNGVIDLGYREEDVADPDGAQLRCLLLDLPPVLGRLALFGLLLGEATASVTARSNSAELLQALSLVSVVAENTDAAETERDDQAESATATPDPIDQDEATDDTGSGTDMSKGVAPLPDWPVIRATVDQLWTEADRLAARLRADADHVAAGQMPTDAEGTANVLTEFATRLADLLATAGQQNQNPVNTLDDVVQAADTAEERDHELAQLLGERAGLEKFLAESSGTSRHIYVQALEKLDEKLAALGESTTPAGAAAEDPAPTSTEAYTAPSRPVGEQAVPSAATQGPAPEARNREPIAEPELSVAETASSATATADDDDDDDEAEHPAAANENDQAPHIPTDEPDTEPEGDTEERLAFPWDAGSPPLVARLVSQGRLTEAYWVTVASDESPLRADVLRFAQAAFATTSVAAASDVLTRLDVGATDDREAVLVEAVARLRCGLVTGWSHRTAELDAMSLPAEWHEFMTAAAEAMHLQCAIGGPTSQATDTGHDPEAARKELARTVRKLQDELPSRRTSYQRATRVQQWLLREGKPLGRLLDLVIAWAEGDHPIDRLRSALTELSGPDAVDELIDHADAVTRSRKQKDPIVANARRSLQRTIQQVIDRAHEAVELASRMNGAGTDDAQVRNALLQKATAARQLEPPTGIGGAALGLLAHWIEEPGRAAAEGTIVADLVDGVSTDALLLLPELPRDRDRLPLLDDPATRNVLAQLAGQLDPAPVVAAYCEQGALDLAERLLKLAPSTVSSEQIETAQRTWRGKVLRTRSETQELLDRLRMQNLVPAEEVSLIDGRLMADVPDGPRAYDLIENEIREVRNEMQRRLDARIDLLRRQTRTDVQDRGVRGRIDALLDGRDVVTATEFLAIHASGKKIPAGAGDPVAQLRDFVMALDSDAGTGDSAADWADVFRPTDEEELPAVAQLSLAAWAELRSARTTKLRQHVESVLRLIGLDPIQGGTEILRLQRADVEAFDVRARPRDGSYIAQLGSAAHNRYRVLVVRDQRRGGRNPLDDVETNGSTIPTIVLYLHSMSPALRAAVAADMRARRAIVVDPPVVGWLAARDPGSFRATQLLTLPWSAFEPYQPFMAGRVAKELFVGREAERDQIVDPSGGLFVYGGRQLGKSALLRRIEAEPGDHQAVVYLDLKGLGIGEAERPERIWTALSAELKQKNVFSPKVSARPTPDAVVSEIKKWLDADDSRQILVLADEADAFLTADSQGEPTRGGMRYFPQMSRLKQLMESTDRRFKVVFAGLHQVQRFGHLPNVPTPHGGPDILIGPLEPDAARRLVVEPLAALGYTFERPELVWRVLAATNYQPAPIQIFCDELLTQLRAARDGATAMPVVITAQDIERATDSRDVRDKIAERMRITINLEDRYRVLALLIARKSLDDGFSRSYDTAELLDEAKEIWPGGFDPSFDETKLEVYLNEMQGLGLLARQPDGRTYAVRSPNVVTMLGTREDFKRDLERSDFVLPYEYSPRLSRRLLNIDADGRQERSPFTDAVLEQLVAAARDGSVPIVSGTEALTIDRVHRTLAMYLEADEMTVEKCRAVGLKPKLTDLARERRTWLVVDLRGSDAETRDEALDRAEANNVPVVGVVDPEQAFELQRSGRDGIVVPERWSVESIRSWPECPFDTPDRRRRLIQVTGGWPAFVEWAVLEVHKSSSTTDTALRQIEERLPAGPQQAASLLAAAGVDDELGRTLWQWAELAEVGEVIPPSDLPDVLELDDETCRRLETRLRLRGLVTEGHNGISLDELTHRCLKVLQEAR